jgi:hypothetical protein
MRDGKGDSTMTEQKFADYDEAVKILQRLAKKNKWVSVFTDRGWGDDPNQKREYTIIKNGDGQNPIAFITADVFKRLREEGKIAENSLQTFKARTLHNFVG